MKKKELNPLKKQEEEINQLFFLKNTKKHSISKIENDLKSLIKELKNKKLLIG